MRSNAKRRGKTPRKRKPPPNRYAKSAKKRRRETVEGDCFRSGDRSSADDEPSGSLVSATPTSTENKLKYTYKEVYEDLDLDSGDSSQI